MNKIITLAVAFLLFIPFASINGNNVALIKNTDGNVLYVGGSGPNNYTKIQDAIDNASDGDAIMVFYNHYHESITLDKELSLIGEEGNRPVIEGVENFTINIVANNCTIKNFVITMNDSITVKISSSFNIIENCYITNPPEGGLCGYALMMINSNHNRMFNNTIESTGGAGIAIRMYGCSDNYFLDNNIIKESVYESLWLIEGSNNTFYGNVIEGLNCWDSDGNIFQNDDFTSKVWVCGSIDDVFENNHFKSMVLYGAINITVRNNIFEGYLHIDGDRLKYYNTHVIENNAKYLKNGPEILYYKNKPNIIVSEKNVAEIIVVNCSNSIIRDIEIDNSYITILVIYSNNTLVYNCSISYKNRDVGYGITVGYSKGCVIRNNNISKIKEGIGVFNSINTRIIKNKIEKTKWGIFITHSIYTTTKRNKIHKNSCGMYLYKNLYTKIRRNDLRENFNGIEMHNTILSVVKRNNFINNTQSTIVYESFINIFFRNHWSKWIIPLPKPILSILISIPWVIVIYYVIFDFCPHLIPYLIT